MNSEERILTDFTDSPFASPSGNEEDEASQHVKEGEVRHRTS